MFNKKQYKIIKSLLQNEYVTCKKFEEILNCSGKTVRNYIVVTNDKLLQNGAKINSKTSKGYSIEVFDEDQFNLYYNDRDFDYLNSKEDRINFIINYLLNKKDYSLIQSLADILYVSEKTISKDLKEIEGVLNDFNLKIHRKQGSGIKLIGLEKNIRSYIIKNNLENDIIYNSTLSVIFKYVILKNSIKLTDIAFDSIVLHLDVMLKRLNDGFCYTETDKEFYQQFYEESWSVAVELASLLESEFKIMIPKEEVKFIAAQLSGKKKLEGLSEKNFIIDEKITMLIKKILSFIYSNERLDFRDDLEVYTLLAQHLIPLKIRLKMKSSLKNPLLEEVKLKFSYPYSIALTINPFIEQEFGGKMDDDETSYIALAIALAMEKKKNKKKYLKNVLLVCISGNVTSKLFEYQFKELFSDCINQIYVCDYSDLINYDFNNIDYIFTTINIDYKLAVPIYKINYIISEEEADDVKGVLVKSKSQFNKYFSKDLFVSNIKVKDKKEVLKMMCNLIEKYKKVDDNLYNLVMKREFMLHSEFGNCVAIPHPYQTVSDDTFVCVCILDEPIKWHSKEVQVILLVSISRYHKENLERFYKALFKFALSKKNITLLLENKTYENFISLVNLE